MITQAILLKQDLYRYVPEFGDARDFLTVDYLISELMKKGAL